jgi:hypothetical protein
MANALHDATPMLKFILLAPLLMIACTADPHSSSTSSLSTSTECDASVPPPPPPGICTIDGEPVDLDSQPANLDHTDGKVTFCHATSSATNPFVLITTSVDACFAHEMHEHLEKGGQLDVFPTAGCVD